MFGIKWSIALSKWAIISSKLLYYLYLTDKEACAVYYTVIKHDWHLRTRTKCRKDKPQASVFYISRVFSNVRSVLSQCNTRLSLLHLLYDVEVMWRKAFFFALYADKTWIFDQSERVRGPIYNIN